MTTKKISKDQITQFLNKLKNVSTDASVRGEWDTNEELQAEIQKFCAILPKDGIRTILMQILDGFICQHPKHPQLWIQYLKNLEYLNGMNTTQKICASRMQRVSLIYCRHPPLQLDPKQLAAEPPTVKEQKESRLNESKQRTDQIFSSVLTAEQYKELSYVCSNCKRSSGAIKTRSAQVRKGDESNMIAERCLYCGKKQTNS